MLSVDKGLAKALDSMRDVLSDEMMTHHSSGNAGTFSYDVWVTCNLCDRSGESDGELDHERLCPIGHITDLFDDIEYPHLKKGNSHD